MTALTLVILPGIRQQQCEGVGAVTLVGYRGVEVPAAALEILAAEAKQRGVALEQVAAERLAAIIPSKPRRSADDGKR
jgi:hypothetical protein